MSFSSLNMGRNVSQKSIADIHSISKSLNIPLKENYHITLIYSTTPVDWEKSAFQPQMPLLLIGPQICDLVAFGDNNDILALEIKAPHLHTRRQELIEAGATTQYPIYRPHISLGPLKNPLVLRNIHFPSITLDEEYRKPTKIRNL
jgi:hypothetical protein